jgi:hypothetical protein
MGSRMRGHGTVSSAGPGSSQIARNLSRKKGLMLHGGDA